MIEAPCKNCKDRLIPKTCEKTCKKWIEYREKLEQRNKIIAENKAIKTECYYNYRRRIEKYLNKRGRYEL